MLPSSIPRCLLLALLPSGAHRPLGPSSRMLVVPTKLNNTEVSTRSCNPLRMGTQARFSAFMSPMLPSTSRLRPHHRLNAPCGQALPPDRGLAERLCLLLLCAP